MHKLVKEDIVTQLQEANEAETRLLIIDRVLEILGWSKQSFKPETRSSTGTYTDYLLEISEEPRLIVEAKRLGVVEPIDRNLQRRDYANSFLWNSCGIDVNNLLEQCRQYCSDCGVPYALATTGNIWIVLVGFKIGIEWGKLRSFVFHSLEDVSKNFHEFYSLISHEAVKNNSLEERFGNMVLVAPSIAIRPREVVVNNAYTEAVRNRQIIQGFFDKFMGEITHQQNMLKYCYVENRRLNEFSQDLKQLLEYDAALDEQDFQIDRVDQQSLEQEVEIQLSTSKPKTILLVGNIGAGKSTFIHRFAFLEAEHKKHACVVIDLINEASIQIQADRQEEQNISRLILDEIEVKLKIDPHDPDTLRGCFERELGRFKKQKQVLVKADPEKYKLEEEQKLASLTEDFYRHLVGYIKYVRKRGFKPWIAFDNVDRGTSSYQDFSYAFAHKLAGDAGCVTLITLREDTFLEAQDAGFVDVRSSHIIFKVNAPEFRQIVSKRRKYVERLIKQNNLPKPFRAHKQCISALNWHIKKLCLDQDDSIRKLITTFTQNNIRFSLAMLRDYYLSYHSTFHDFVDLYQFDEEDGELSLDFNSEYSRFIQALMLNNSWSYSEQDSGVFNLFSADRQERTSHFLVMRLLAYLSLDQNTLSVRNILLCEKIFDDFIFLGYHRHHINSALRRLFQFGLVMSPNLSSIPNSEKLTDIPDPLPLEAKILLSPKGYYYFVFIQQDLAEAKLHEMRK